MKVTVIGGSGFVGTRLCQRFELSKKVDFTIIDKSKSNFFENKVFISNIRFPICNEFFKDSSVIINLAAEHRDNVIPKSLYYETNVVGAKNICSIARKNNIKKIIFTSSVAVYGFAPLGTDEHGRINPFNEYGKSKWEAENVYRDWQSEDPKNRTLVILRPTVIFGERNRGNVFNLLSHISSGKFVMVGDGLNRKSLAYVENVAAFIEYSLDFKPGIHIFNYVDKPNFTMNDLVAYVSKLLGRSSKIEFRLPLSLGLLIGFGVDLVAKITGQKFPISAIRIKKFCANSVYESAIESTGFVPTVPLLEAIEKTVRFEFIEDHRNEHIFYSE